MADPDKLAALQKHLDELQSESTEALAERYGLTPSDLTTTERVIQNIFKVIDPDWISSKIAETPTDASYSMAAALRQAESRRQGGSTAYQGPLWDPASWRSTPATGESATEMIDKLRRETQTSRKDE